MRLSLYITAMITLLSNQACLATELSVDTSTTVTGKVSEQIPILQNNAFTCTWPPFPAGVTGVINSTITSMTGDKLGEHQCSAQKNVCTVTYGHYVYDVVGTCSWALQNTGNWVQEDRWIRAIGVGHDSSGHAIVPALHTATASLPSVIDLGSMRPHTPAVATAPVTLAITGGDPSGEELTLCGNGTDTTDGVRSEYSKMTTSDGSDAGSVYYRGTTGKSTIPGAGTCIHVTGNEILEFTYTPEKAYGRITGVINVTLSIL